MTTRRRSTLAVVLGIMAVMLALVHATAYDANANRPGPTMARFILPDFGIDGVDPFGPFGFSDGNLHYWGKEPPPGGNESFTRECDEIQREITNATLTMTAICGAIGAGLAVVTVLEEARRLQWGLPWRPCAAIWEHNLPSCRCVRRKCAGDLIRPGGREYQGVASSRPPPAGPSKEEKYK